MNTDDKTMGPSDAPAVKSDGKNLDKRVKAALQDVARQVRNAKAEEVVKVPGLGSFQIKEASVEREGTPTIRRRVIFRPAAGQAAAAQGLVAKPAKKTPEQRAAAQARRASKGQKAAKA